MHNLFNARFYQNRDEPAWHRLGLNTTRPMTALEALGAVGEYIVTREPSFVQIGGMALPTGNFSVVRHPTADDPQYRIFGGAVSADFELLGPNDAAKLWDANVRAANGASVPVETFGVLGHGERLFMTTRLPSFSVKGDETAVYLLYDNPIEPGQSVGVYTVPVRVVCQNTLVAALGQAIQTKRIVHTAGAANFVAAWLRNIYGNAVRTRDLMEQAFNQLASTPVNSVQVKWVVTKTYPMPKKPSEDSKSRMPYAERLEKFEAQRDLISRKREAVLALFDGAGTGFDSPAVRDTAFGVYNAVAGYETYRRGDGGYNLNVVRGDRALTIRRAYEYASKVETA